MAEPGDRREKNIRQSDGHLRRESSTVADGGEHLRVATTPTKK